MKRISFAIFSLVIFTSISNLLSHDSESSPEVNHPSSDYNDEGNYGKITTMYGDVGGPAITDENGGMGFDICCSEEEWNAIIAFLVFIGVLSFLIVRKVWKFVKKKIFRKSVENRVNEEVVVDNELLGSHLPVSEKEFVAWKMGKVGVEKRNKKEHFSLKEEFILLSIFLFVIYLFWNNGL